MTAARGNLHCFAVQTHHFAQFDDVVPGGVDDLQSVADLEFILDVNLGDAVRTSDDVADILLAAVPGMTAHIVLLFMGVVALVKAVGIAAMRQRIQCA